MSYTSALVWQMAAQSQVRALLTAVFFLFWIWRLPFQAPDRPFQRHRRGQQCPLPLGLRSAGPRSEEHTSELQSLRHLVCRLLLEKKKRFRLLLSVREASSTHLEGYRRADAV